LFVTFLGNCHYSFHPVELIEGEVGSSHTIHNEIKNGQTYVARKWQRKTPLGRFRHLLVTNDIRMELREVGCEGVHWIDEKT
jgi:hypothetical protein